MLYAKCTVEVKLKWQSCLYLYCLLIPGYNVLSTLYCTALDDNPLWGQEAVLGMLRYKVYQGTIHAESLNSLNIIPISRTITT